MYHDGHSAPSTPAEMTSGDLLHSIIAFPLISVTERRLKSWLVGSLSSHPFFLARACPMRLTTPVATLWKPPRVSTARGEELQPLGSASIRRVSHFPIIGFLKSLASFSCRACHISWGERAGNSDIYGDVLAIVPSSDEDIPWSSSSSWEEMGFLS